MLSDDRGTFATIASITATLPTALDSATAPNLAIFIFAYSPKLNDVQAMIELALLITHVQLTMFASPPKLNIVLLGGQGRRR